MFDYVNVEMDCPYCGEPLDGFQTKDYKNILTCVDPTEVNNFYSFCENCKVLVEFDRQLEFIHSCREKPYSREEVEELGFSLVKDSDY